LEEYVNGRVEEWKDGIMEKWRVESCELLNKLYVPYDGRASPA